MRNDINSDTPTTSQIGRTEWTSVKKLVFI